MTSSISQQLTYKEGRMLPQEEMLEIGRIKKKLTIGIPREIDKYENRIILTPKAVAELVYAGHRILMEANAGERSNWSDEEYKISGASISSKQEVYKSEIILKVSPFLQEEIKLLSGGQIIVSALHSNIQSIETIVSLMRKKITAVGLELIKDENDFFPFLHSMSEIAGIIAVTTAGEYLSNSNNGKGVLLGGITGITPTEIMIIGAGTAGEYAARAALGLGASVKVFDSSIIKLRKLQTSLGHQIFTSVLQQDVLIENIIKADAVIGALEYTGGRVPFLICEEIISRMKKGSVIIDLNTDNESCFATSRVTNFGNPTFKKFGIVHYCVPNIASKASRTASISLSNAFLPILHKMSQISEIQFIIKEDKGIRNGTYIFNGILTNEHLGKKFGIDFKDLNLLTSVL